MEDAQKADIIKRLIAKGLSEADAAKRLDAYLADQVAVSAAVAPGGDTPDVAPVAAPKKRGRPPKVKVADVVAEATGVAPPAPVDVAPAVAPPAPDGAPKRKRGRPPGPPRESIWVSFLVPEATRIKTDAANAGMSANRFIRAELRKAGAI